MKAKILSLSDFNGINCVIAVDVNGVSIPAFVPKSALASRFGAFAARTVVDGIVSIDLNMIAAAIVGQELSGLALKPGESFIEAGNNITVTKSRFIIEGWFSADVFTLAATADKRKGLLPEQVVTFSEIDDLAIESGKEKRKSALALLLADAEATLAAEIAEN